MFTRRRRQVTLRLFYTIIYHNRAKIKSDGFKSIEGLENLDKVIDIDQSPIGRTPRSNPATYTGAFDLIRDIFAGTNEAKIRGYEKGRFKACVYMR